MMHRYIKAVPRQPRSRSAGISYALMSTGFLIVAWTLWPILSFGVIRGALSGDTLSPLAEGRGGGGLPAAVLAAVDSSEASLDYTNPNVWFPTSPQKKVVTRVNSYSLTIPKLKIRDATVIIAGDDLSKSIIHYGGTAEPGEYGTAVLFGHSTLPQFFSPTNYKSIFSTLPTLKVEDEIFVTYDTITYRYVVEEMNVTKPTDLSPLEQKFDNSYLTLITCVPPGTYWERLNVKAKLARL